MKKKPETNKKSERNNSKSFRGNIFGKSALLFPNFFFSFIFVTFENFTKRNAFE